MGRKNAYEKPRTNQTNIKLNKRRVIMDSKREYPIATNNTCFAYFNDACLILVNMPTLPPVSCNNCNFFKTKAQFETDTLKGKKKQ